MGFLLALAFAVTGQEGQPPPAENAVMNARSLVTHDLWEAERGTGRFRILSLKPSSVWPSGTAWLVDLAGGRNPSLQAFQGKYTFTGDKLADDTLLLTVSFTRKYTSLSGDGRLRWQLDVDCPRDARGVVIEIPLNERSVPPPPVTFVVTEAFFLDRGGERTHRFAAGKFFSQGRELEADSTDHLRVGETLRLSDTALDADVSQSPSLRLLRESPPPGFKLRLSETTATQLSLGNSDFVGGQFDQAVVHYSMAIAANPREFDAFRFRGYAYSRLGRYEMAIADYTAAIRIRPDDPRGYNGAAWCLATCPDAGHRDGKRAVELATRACRLTGWKDGFYLDTLAAAEAEAGDFSRAVEWQSKALQNTGSISKSEIEECRLRLRLYKQAKPYRETSAPTPAASSTVASDR